MRTGLLGAVCRPPVTLLAAPVTMTGAAPVTMTGAALGLGPPFLELLEPLHLGDLPFVDQAGLQ